MLKLNLTACEEVSRKKVFFSVITRLIHMYVPSYKASSTNVQQLLQQQKGSMPT